jgi:hypothetical protein
VAEEIAEISGQERFLVGFFCLQANECFASEIQEHVTIPPIIPTTGDSGAPG